MSKDIWHITNQDKNTTDMPEKENFVVLIGHWTSCLWYGGEEPEPIFWKNVKKWCYLDDLLALETELERTRKALEQSEICCTEWEKQALDYKAENIALSGDLERTRKALDVAVDALKKCHETFTESEAFIVANKHNRIANKALEQITALEQKDVK